MHMSDRSPEDLLYDGVTALGHQIREVIPPLGVFIGGLPQTTDISQLLEYLNQAQWGIRGLQETVAALLGREVTVEPQPVAAETTPVALVAPVGVVDGPEQPVAAATKASTVSPDERADPPRPRAAEPAALATSTVVGAGAQPPVIPTAAISGRGAIPPAPARTVELGSDAAVEVAAPTRSISTDGLSIDAIGQLYLNEAKVDFALPESLTAFQVLAYLFAGGSEVIKLTDGRLNTEDWRSALAPILGQAPSDINITIIQKDIERTFKTLGYAGYAKPQPRQLEGSFVITLKLENILPGAAALLEPYLQSVAIAQPRVEDRPENVIEPDRTDWRLHFRRFGRDEAVFVSDRRLNQINVVGRAILRVLLDHALVDDDYANEQLIEFGKLQEHANTITTASPRQVVDQLDNIKAALKGLGLASRMVDIIVGGDDPYRLLGLIRDMPPDPPSFLARAGAATTS